MFLYRKHVIVFVSPIQTKKTPEPFLFMHSVLVWFYILSTGPEVQMSAYLDGGAAVKAKGFGLSIFQIDFQNIWHKKK